MPRPMATAGRCISFGMQGLEFAVLSRHGEAGYDLSAPFLNPRANLYALKGLGVTKILAWVAPGSLRQEMAPGDLVVPHDVLDEGQGGPQTFFSGVGWGFIRHNPVVLPGTPGSPVGGPGRGAVYGPQPRGLRGHHRAAAGDGRGDPQVPPPGRRPGGPDPGAGGLFGPGAGILLRRASLTW